MKRLVSSRLLRCAATAEILFVVACGGGGSAPPGALLLSGINPTVGSAVGGTPVTLVGTNFQAGATVTFGAAQATGVTYDSSNALSAITPAGALGAVNVTVTNPDGQSSVLTSGFTYQEPTCAVPALITGDTTLGPTCIWVATATVNVGGASNPVLTVLPGTTVMFSGSQLGGPGVSLQVGLEAPGSLVVVGTSDAGVLFTSASATPDAGDWGGIVIGPYGSGTLLQYLSVEYAGGLDTNSLPETDSAAVTVEGGDVFALSASQTPAPVLSNVSVDFSGGHGLVFAGLDTGFGPDGGNISVTNWEPSSHFPFVIEANQGGSIPSSISAPVPDAGVAYAVVAFHSYVSDSCLVQASTTWPAIPLPYLAVDTINIISQSSTGPADTLSIAAPNIIEFAPGTELDVDPPPAGDMPNGNSFLVANATASNSIVFTSNSATPAPAAWGGINFWCSSNNQNSGSSLQYANLQWAASVKSGPTGTGEITVLDGLSTPTGPLGPPITNCTFGNYGSTGFGIALFDVQTATLNAYLANNTFATPNQVIQYCSGQITDGTCPVH